MYALPTNLSEKLISTLGEAKNIITTPKKLKHIPIIPFLVKLWDNIKTDKMETETGLKPIIKEASEAAVFCIPNMYPIWYKKTEVKASNNK